MMQMLHVLNEIRPLFHAREKEQLFGLRQGKSRQWERRRVEGHKLIVRHARDWAVIYVPKPNPLYERNPGDPQEAVQSVLDRVTKAKRRARVVVRLM
jgi:hypothetical protein